MQSFLLITCLNFAFLMFLTYRLAQMRTEIFYLQRGEKPIETKKFQFLAVKDFRPTDGTNIFVWDCVDRRAIPVQYKGNYEDWVKSKDTEKRFTHFVELSAPD